MGRVMQKGPGRHDLISSNLHLKSSKNGGSNWILIQGAIFTVSIVISGQEHIKEVLLFRTFVTSIMLFGE